MSIKIILVPIGGDKGSMTALNRAIVIAKRFGAHIKGLHVMGRVSDAVSFEFHLPAGQRHAQRQADQGRRPVGGLAPGVWPRGRHSGAPRTSE